MTLNEMPPGIVSEIRCHESARQSSRQISKAKQVVSDQGANRCTKGITIQDLMIRVRKPVMEETKNEQIPREEAALNEPFSFVQAAHDQLGDGQAGGTAQDQPASQPGRRHRLRSVTTTSPSLRAPL
jgi:hypothetical protein